MADDLSPRNQTLPPELYEEEFRSRVVSPDFEEEQLPQYEAPRISQRMMTGTAEATDDGRVVLNLDSKIAQVFASLVEIPEEGETFDSPPDYPGEPWTVCLNIVLQVVGSRGDVQPFVALGNELQKYGHRVRLATHDVFKSFVKGAGLEFFPIGGDPKELMAYMVKNPGLIPNMKSLREREIIKKRKMIAQMLTGCWKSCILPDPDSGEPFLANAIIANPPSFAHIHCAQALSIPLHLVFTMPWSPTRAFPHPLANIQNTSTDPKLANYLSYSLVQVLLWQGLGDVINAWRNTLGLEDVPLTEGPFLSETLKIPYTYCWSPSLVPKPVDWPPRIDVSGFMFQPTTAYTPSEELQAFLKAGPPPIYVGFGSIVVDDPDALLTIVLDAIQICGTRAIVSQSWSNLSRTTPPGNVLLIGDCPHDWLFKNVSVVVHHGGAGTTATGLRCGRPTCIVPFFGDQPFWGDKVAAAGAGPLPIPHKRLTPKKLADGIKTCLSPDAVRSAQVIADRMQKEDGVQAAVTSFHRHLSSKVLRCDLVPTLPAVYEYSRKKTMKLSGSAADTLIKHGKIKQGHLSLYEPKPVTIENRRWDSVTGGVAASIGMAYDMLSATNDLWYAPHKLRMTTQETGEEVGESSSSITKRTSAAKHAKQTARMVGASAMTIPRLYGIMLKGFAVDTPLAIAEGLRATPRLYGQEVKDHEPITGIGSGLKVAGKDIYTQFGGGLADLVVQPYKGARAEGTLGFAKGVGRGLLAPVFKSGAALTGLIAYPAQGIYKSLYTLTHDRTKREILSARRVHDIYFARTEAGKVDEQLLLDAFDALGTPKNVLSRSLSLLSSTS